MKLRSLVPMFCLSTALSPALLAQVTQFGNGCPSSGGTMPTISVQGAPFAGAPLTIDVTGPVGKAAYLMIGFSNQSYRGTALPYSLAPFGNPGCEILVGPALTASLRLDAQGRASLSIPGILPAGTVIYAQALMVFGPPGVLVDGATEGLEITVMSPSTLPTIGSLSRLSGGVGDVLTIRGANFGNGPATDVCMAVADQNDELQAFLKVETRSDTEMTATIKAVRPGAVVGRLGFVQGTGQVAPVTQVPGATPSQDAWSWHQAAVSPSNMAMSSQNFTARQSFADAGASCVPCEDDFVWFHLSSGQLVAQLPDLCDGVTFSLWLCEFWWTDSQGNNHRVEYQLEQVATCGMNAAARANYLALMLSVSLSPHGLTAFAPNANTLTISVLGGFNSSSIGGALSLAYTYDPAFRVSATDGICDNFALPTEPAIPSLALQAWQTANYPAAPLAPFDEPQVNKHFLHSIPIPAGPGTTVTGMSLQLELKALNSSLSSNDSISLVVNGGTLVWGMRISSLPGAGGTWTPGQTLSVCLDLANLPASGSGVTSVLAEAIAAGEVDIRIEDDTSVDCACLTVQRCQ